MSESPGSGLASQPVDPVIEAYKAGVDRTLLRENLKKTPQERVETLIALLRVAEELRRAGRALRSAS